MKEILKILHLEDLPDDAELVTRALKKAGLQFETVLAETKEDFVNSLRESIPDIILSDHSLSAFDSLEALKIVKEAGIDIPFILVTATVSEEYAVNIIKEGASDYILKDRLQRLPNAIINAVEKHELNKQQLFASEAIQVSERNYKLQFASNPLPMWMINKATLNIIAANEAAINHYGFSRNEFLKLKSTDLTSTEETGRYFDFISSKTEGMSEWGVWKHRKKDGTIIMVDIIAHDLVYENKPARLMLANDVTQKLLAEEELAKQRLLQQKLIMETGIEAQENEREKIGRELHDNINQLLAVSKFYISHALRKKTPDLDSIHKSSHYISTAIDEIRKLSHELAAPTLDDISFLSAVEILVTEISKITTLRVTFSEEGFDEGSIDRHKKLTLYRIIQEQTNNILKHAGAKNVTIKLVALSEHIYLSIQDDGCGFDPAVKPEGIGLRNIRNRVEFVDGTILIISAPGKGCTLEVGIPIN